MRGSTFAYLTERAAEGHPIRVGLVGVGQMGAGIVAQSAHIPGLEIVALSDIDTDRARRALAHIGVEATESTDDPDRAADVVGAGGVIITRAADLVPALPIDVVVEATGIPEVGAQVALAAAFARTDLVSMNVEADVTVGRALQRMFDLAGCVYSLAAGDEPSAAGELVDFARTIGLEVVCAGKGKNNPLRRSATPSSVASEAAVKNMNPRMLAAFVDGTKTMCEMAALANATGLAIDKPGMHGPAANVADLTRFFRIKEEGGLLSQAGAADYVTGDVAPGVFAVVRSDDPAIVSDIEYLKLGKGPYWALVRPYHLANLEVPMTIVRVVRDRRPTLAPDVASAEVVAVAKRDLNPGDNISGIGGEEVYGSAYPAAKASAADFVPLGLVEGAEIISATKADEPLTWSDVRIEESGSLLRLWRMQLDLDGLPSPTEAGNA